MGILLAILVFIIIIDKLFLWLEPPIWWKVFKRTKQENIFYKKYEEGKLLNYIKLWHSRDYDEWRIKGYSKNKNITIGDFKIIKEYEFIGYFKIFKEYEFIGYVTFKEVYQKRVDTICNFNNDFNYIDNIDGEPILYINITEDGSTIEDPKSFERDVKLRELLK